MVDSKDYEGMTVTELREMAGERNIEGRSGMDKEALVLSHMEYDERHPEGDDNPAEGDPDAALPSEEETEQPAEEIEPGLGAEPASDLDVDPVSPLALRSKALKDDAKYVQPGE